MTRSSSVVRVRIKSLLSVINDVVDTEVPPRLCSMTDMRSDDDDGSPSLLSRTSFDLLSKFVVSELSSQFDKTDDGTPASELCTDVTAGLGLFDGTITIGAKSSPAYLFGCETVSDVSRSEPSRDSRQVFELILWRFFLSRS